MVQQFIIEPVHARGGLMHFRNMKWQGLLYPRAAELFLVPLN